MTPALTAAFVAFLTLPLGTKILAGVTLATSFIDPAWATPVQTILLILLLVVQSAHTKKVTDVDTKLDTNTEKTDNAALSAANAAQAAATAARIMQEIGGALRHVDPPAAVIPQEATTQTIIPPQVPPQP